MANVRRPTEGPMSPGGEYPETVGSTRREALQNGAKLVLAAGIGAQIMAATGAETAIAKQVRSVASRAGNKPGYGPLVRTGQLRLPAGFQAFEFGKAGTPMSDGNRTPKHHDGSTLFDAGNGRLTMIRNQERAGFGKAISKHNAYDRHAKGGVTTSLFDTGTGELIGSSLVLNGTDNNCNGGKTPWGTWLTCEESTVGAHKGYEREHGYVFEIPMDATSPIDPKPIKAMGRFLHEACAIDPKTGIVYMTEDEGPDGFYRYIPDHAGQLHRGGKLQMLCIKGRSRYNTVTGQKVGERLPCEWVTIKDPDPEDAERNASHVYKQGRDQGAARFMGLEGANWAQGSVWFTASEAGDLYAGQVWRYTPSRNIKKGTLELVYESNKRSVLDEPDAIVVSPRGGVVLCEDGDGEDGGFNYLRVLAPNGKMETFGKITTPLLVTDEEDLIGKDKWGRTEWSGACYSPDGKWLFVNLYQPGVSYAITGPWEKGWM
ncbi:MAG TPA: alkaline phosphatase PhoX [Solirubrobacterales bacterium]|nr:alkaline phosphatase PhoX [Solirubrobacterales bacterium]